MAKAYFSNISPRDQLGKLVEDISNSGCKHLKDNDLKEFKSLCKNGDDDLIDFVYRILILQLEKKHCQKRYSTILLVEQLFPRSHRFRTLFTEQDNLTRFFELTLGTDEKNPLPKPRSYAKLLKEKVNLLMRQWIDKYGRGYPTLEQIYKFSIAFISSNFNRTNSDDEVRINSDSRHSNQINQVNEPTHREIRQVEKIDRKLEEFVCLDSELPDQLTQIRNLFELIIPKDEFLLDQMNNNKQDEDNEIESRLMKTNNLGNLNRKNIAITLKTYLEIKITEDNLDTIEVLRDHYKQLINNYLPKIKNLLKHLSKGGKRCENQVKQLIEYKNGVLELVSKYSELKFKDSNENEDDDSVKNESNCSSTDDDDFEEVEEKDIEWEIPPERWSEYGIKDPFVNKYNDPDQPSTSGLSNSNSNLKDFDPKSCNVKMENGKLCKRKDKVTCPFHGPIQPRDAEGNLLDQELRKLEEEETRRRENDWQDPKYLKELENQIGIDLTIKKVKKKKNPELLNLKTCDETPKTRLLKKMKVLKR